MGNTAMTGELPGGEELGELYRLDASESDPESDPENEPEDDDEDNQDGEDDEGEGKEGIKPDGMPHD